MDVMGVGVWGVDVIDLTEIYNLVVIIKTPISIKNNTNIFVLTRDLEIPTIFHNFCSSGSQPMLSDPCFQA